MPAQPIAQCRVQQVGSGMVRTDCIAPFAIDIEVHRVADCNLASGNLAMMDMQPPKRLRRICDFDL